MESCKAELERNMIVKLGLAVLASAFGVSAIALMAGHDAKWGEAASAQAPADSSAAAPVPAMIPARLLDCALGRIANFDPSRSQPISEYVYDGHHAFRLFLPAIPVRTTPPPEAMSPAEPVDPKTKILADPDGLARETTGRPFDRVVDTWPQRVEMTTPISDIASNLIIIDQVDAAQSRATLFMTKANDAVTFDLKHLYLGTCKVTTGKAAETVHN